MSQLKSNAYLGQKPKWQDERKKPQTRHSQESCNAKEKVPIAKVRKNEASSSSTTEGLKERLCEPNGEQEKNTFRDSTQGLERMFVEQNECVTTLIEEHNLRTLKRRRILGDNEAWGGQTIDLGKWKYRRQYRWRWFVGFLFGSGLGSFIQVICLFKEWVSYNLFRINGSWPLLEIFGIKFFTIAFASCIFMLKECMNSSIYIVFLHNKTFLKKPYYSVRRHQNF